MSKKNILVTGASGQLGSELRLLAPKFAAFNFLFTDKQELPITNIDLVDKYFNSHKIQVCINCAAYTAVDKAEEEQSIAFDINSTAVGLLARASNKYSAKFIHISTDYVYKGSGNIPYTEADETDPINLYGASKLNGELLAIENQPSSVIIRTSWLYSRYGKNFVNTIKRLLQEKESIGVVNDQFGSPTYAADLAAAILQIITENESPAPGIYNYCNKGVTNWFDFACAINDILKTDCIVQPLTTAQYPTAAKRPAYSAFNTTKIEQTFSLEIPEWRESLQRCLLGSK